ncbi:MAG: glycosyltransferase, partial [Lutibacter sp.]
MRDLNLAVVVLNYVNYHETIDCVNSILEQTYKKFNIIIVENGSQNESFSILNGLFGNNPLIKILKNDINLGFAKGNNIGIRYVRKELKA